MKIIEKKISVKEYNELTQQVGWGQREESIVDEALDNTFYSVCAYENNQLVGYGRLIGDRTIFLYVQDIMVIPSCQYKGVGTQIMNAIICKILSVKQKSPTLRVYLGASKDREGFYKRFGFTTRLQAGLGAGMIFLKNHEINECLLILRDGPDYQNSLINERMLWV
ncbi:GNAT family N-acetyltransferase [Eubacterium barkeri]|uniref:Acetyltransferase (GNAT) domain-containing protein n=1 Tax=Eubacterium barkeri TaxID=1528 RepID=A0A1H3K769_EUBBA|nr:GNAT family N-acetyltransferase [Eubacterium barkeri]SDY48067.1 Acetyltransferase (GNAT) domain-containing protein [Eubacterium barkeri]